MEWTRTHLAVVMAVALVLGGWWWWNRRDQDIEVVSSPEAPLPTAPVPPPGIPPTLVDKIARAVDESIPVVVTSGAPVQYTDSEIAQVTSAALRRVNSQGENLVLISVASASKTQDSYKNTAYELVVNVHDTAASIGLLLALSLVVSDANAVYVRAMRLYNDVPDPMVSLRAASEPAGNATFEDPLDMLSQLKVGATAAMPAQAMEVTKKVQ